MGKTAIGGSAPVTVQSMLNTRTTDVDACIRQINELTDAGCDLIRIAVPDEASAAAFGEIAKKTGLPLIADVHYSYKLAHLALDGGAKKIRMNPGNMRDFSEIGALARRMSDAGVPVRVGVNGGSLEKDLRAKYGGVTAEALVESAVASAKRAMDVGLPAEKIVLSAKVSGVPDLVHVYEELARRSRCCLHLGLTEAGMGMKGMVSSAAALSILLNEGIGDTIRVSLTPKPGESRAEEVRVAQQILQSLELRSFTPEVTACPGCGRTSSDLFQRLAKSIEEFIREQMPVWKSEFPGVERMKVAVMGCVVNGPGESAHADIGISLPGSGENPVAPVYMDGKRWGTLKGQDIDTEFKKLLTDYVRRTYGPKGE